TTGNQFCSVRCGIFLAGIGNTHRTSTGPETFICCRFPTPRVRSAQCPPLTHLFLSPISSPTLSSNPIFPQRAATGELLNFRRLRAGRRRGPVSPVAEEPHAAGHRRGSRRPPKTSPAANREEPGAGHRRGPTPPAIIEARAVRRRCLALSTAVELRATCRRGPAPPAVEESPASEGKGRSHGARVSLIAKESTQLHSGNLDPPDDYTTNPNAAHPYESEQQELVQLLSIWQKLVQVSSTSRDPLKATGSSHDQDLGRTHMNASNHQWKRCLCVMLRMAADSFIFCSVAPICMHV
ncbi:unnamed protein product, partial [Urochloa humidicola]